VSNYHLELVNVYVEKMRDQNNFYTDLEDRRKRAWEARGHQYILINVKSILLMMMTINECVIKSVERKNDQSFLTFVLQSMSFTVYIKDDNSINLTPSITMSYMFIQTDWKLTSYRNRFIEKLKITYIYIYGCITYRMYIDDRRACYNTSK
jgi:hypothetical protein